MSQLALLGGHPAVQTPFLNGPVFDRREVEAVVAAVESGQWWMGKDGNPVVKALESGFSKFQGTRYALAMTNGNHALEIILRNLGIGAGDEVIIPAYAPVATAAAVLLVGATPILVDVQLDTMTLDPVAVQSAITPRTRAIISVYLGGVAGAIDDILKIAQKHQVFVVEDCTQAHGAESRGRKVGSLGVAAAFDFHSRRMIAGGEGGMIVTSDRKLYEKCWSQHNCGRRLGKSRGDYYAIGTNYRIATFQAAVIQIQLERFITDLPKRLENIDFLDRSLSQVRGITPQFRHPQDKAPAYRYSFRYDPSAFEGLPRDRFVEALRAEGVPCQVSAYQPLYQLPLFQYRQFGSGGQSLTQDLKGHSLPNYSALSLPNTEQLAQTVVCLPHQVMLGEPHQIKAIVEAIHKIQENAHALLPATLPA